MGSLPSQSGPQSAQRSNCRFHEAGHSVGRSSAIRTPIRGFPERAVQTRQRVPVLSHHTAQALHSLFANRERTENVLNTQDLLILLRLLPWGNTSHAQLSGSLGMSSSEVHAGLKRLKQSRLVKSDVSPIRSAVREVLRYGVPYFLPAVRGELTRGMPTACAAPPLNAHIAQGSDPPPIWPDPEGPVRGQALAPPLPLGTLRRPSGPSPLRMARAGRYSAERKHPRTPVGRQASGRAPADPGHVMSNVANSERLTETACVASVTRGADGLRRWQHLCLLHQRRRDR